MTKTKKVKIKDSKSTQLEEPKTKKRKHDDVANEPSVSSSPSKKSKSKKDTTARTTTTPRHTKPPSNPPFIKQCYSFYVPISPISLGNPLAGACAEHLSPLILTYYPPLKGVVIAYSNPQLSLASDGSSMASESKGSLGRAVDEFAAAYAWITADFIIFKPQRGQELEGWVNLQTETHISLVCWNYFTASIEKKRLPPEWTWVGESLIAPRKTKGKLRDSGEDPDGNKTRHNPSNSVHHDLGHYEDEGRKITDDSIKFRVVDIELSADPEASKGFIGITGTLLSDEDESELVEQERITNQERSFASAHRRKDGGAVMSGAIAGRPRKGK